MHLFMSKYLIMVARQARSLFSYYTLQKTPLQFATEPCLMNSQAHNAQNPPPFGYHHGKSAWKID